MSTQHLTQSGAMTLFNGTAGVHWGSPEHVDSLRNVWATLTPLTHSMCRETFPAAVALIEGPTQAWPDARSATGMRHVINVESRGADLTLCGRTILDTWERTGTFVATCKPCRARLH